MKRDERLGRLEHMAREIGGLIGMVCDETVTPKAGFALLIFDLGEGGWMTYISNAQREDMLTAMKEFIAKEEAGIVTPAGEEVTEEH